MRRQFVLDERTQQVQNVLPFRGVTSVNVMPEQKMVLFRFTEGDEDDVDAWKAFVEAVKRVKQKNVEARALIGRFVGQKKFFNPRDLPKGEFLELQPKVKEVAVLQESEELVKALGVHSKGGAARYYTAIKNMLKSDAKLKAYWKKTANVKLDESLAKLYALQVEAVKDAESFKNISTEQYGQLIQVLHNSSSDFRKKGTGGFVLRFAKDNIFTDVELSNNPNELIVGITPLSFLEGCKEKILDDPKWTAAQRRAVQEACVYKEGFSSEDDNVLWTAVFDSVSGMRGVIFPLTTFDTINKSITKLPMWRNIQKTFIGRARVVTILTATTKIAWLDYKEEPFYVLSVNITNNGLVQMTTNAVYIVQRGNEEVKKVDNSELDVVTLANQRIYNIKKGTIVEVINADNVVESTYTIADVGYLHKIAVFNRFLVILGIYEKVQIYYMKDQNEIVLLNDLSLPNDAAYCAINARFVLAVSQTEIFLLDTMPNEYPEDGSSVGDDDVEEESSPPMETESFFKSNANFKQKDGSADASVLRSLQLLFMDLYVRGSVPLSREKYEDLVNKPRTAKEKLRVDVPRSSTKKNMYAETKILLEEGLSDEQKDIVRRDDLYAVCAVCYKHDNNKPIGMDEVRKLFNANSYGIMALFAAHKEWPANDYQTVQLLEPLAKSDDPLEKKKLEVCLRTGLFRWLPTATLLPEEWEELCDAHARGEIIY